MAKKKTNEITAGIFVVLMLGVTLGVVLWLGAADIFTTRGQRVSFFVSESDGNIGLQEGSELYYGGARIGKIYEVQPKFGSGCYYRARLDRKDIRLRSDAQATVSVPFIGTPKLVVTTLGTDDAKEPDDEHPILLKPGGLDAMMAAAGNEFNRDMPGSVLAKIHGIIDSLSQIAESLNAEMKETGKIYGIINDLGATAAAIRKETDTSVPRSLLAKLGAALDDVHRMTTSLAGETDPTKRGTLLAKVHTGLDGINEIIGDAKPKVAKALDAVEGTAVAIQGYAKKDIAEMLANFREINTNILKVSKDFTETSQTVKNLLVGNRGNLDEMIDNMVLVSANLKATSKEVRRNPWRLLYQPDDKELRSADIYDAVSAYSDGATQLNQAITKLRALRRLPADDPQIKETVAAIRKHLGESFKKLKKVEEKLWKEFSK